jgi:hypothetical protein
MYSSDQEIETVCTDLASAVSMQIGLFYRSLLSAVGKRDPSAARMHLWAKEDSREIAFKK